MDPDPSLYPLLQLKAVAPTLETLAAASALETLAAAEKDPTQQFRLQKIGECEAFLRSEIESRSRLYKKYRRVVDALDGSFAGIGATGFAMGAGGASLIVTGIGVIPGLILEGLTMLAFVLEIGGLVASRRWSTKAIKHDEIRVLALSKLNTVHSHISKALEDCSISNEEYKLILDEIEKYRVMKDEIQHKYKKPVGTLAEKNELLKRGREEARVAFMKHLAASAQPSV